MPPIDFLRARLDDDEAVARRTGGVECGTWSTPRSGVDFDQYEVPGIHPSTGAHIVRWSPERVLAEVPAKRLVLREHDRSGGGCGHRASEALDEASGPRSAGGSPLRERSGGPRTV